MTDPLNVTRRGKPIDLEGLWSPNPAFLVASGPDLEKFDLARLKERGVASLGVNNAAARAPVKAWCFGDPQDKFHHGLYLDPTVMTFSAHTKIHRKIKARVNGRFHNTRVRVDGTPNTFTYERGTGFDPDQFFTTTWAHWGKGKQQPEGVEPAGCLATLFCGFRILHYLGVRRIYLLGVDHGNRRRYRQEQEAFERLLPTFERAGLEMFNCNKKSGCKVFPFVDFDVAVEDCKGSVPPEPFDVTDWYDKRKVARQCSGSRPFVPRHYDRTGRSRILPSKIGMEDRV